MHQVHTAPTITQAQAEAWLNTLDVNALGLRADAASRARHADRAGYRHPLNLILGPHGWLDASTGRNVSCDGQDVRIVDLDPHVSADQLYQCLADGAAGGTWIEGLVTSDLERLGLDPVRLRECGLKRVLGSHCEGFSGARRSIRGEHDWAEAMAWYRKVAAAGLRLHVDLLYGEDETTTTLSSRLLDVWHVQDQTQAVDALVPIPHNGTRALETPAEITFGFDDMRLLATARLVLDNVAHIQVPWLPFGLKAAQMGLIFGGDDLGPWCLDPGVTEEAHVATLLALREEEVIMAIKDSGRQPVLWKGQE